MQIHLDAPPQNSLIAPFAEADGHYTDAFWAEGEGELQSLVVAFYTSPLFKLERMVLRIFAKAPSQDAEVLALAEGACDRFAVWRVEARNDREILLGDASGRTKSWLAVRDGRIWFGSVVVPVKRRGRLVLGPVFDTLLGAHKVYSRMLLSAAIHRLKRM